MAGECVKAAILGRYQPKSGSKMAYGVDCHIVYDMEHQRSRAAQNEAGVQKAGNAVAAHLNSVCLYGLALQHVRAKAAGSMLQQATAAMGQ